MSSPALDWATGERSGQVSIGSHSLHLHAYGPDRTPGEPAVIIIQGLASSIKSWASVRRLLAPFIRTYLYDRSGYGQSEASVKKPTSTTIAAELDLLLKNAGISAPYILVAHSWGGILSREFFALRPGDVAGIVFVDANQESTLKVLDWRNPALWAVAKNVDFFEATGLAREHKLTEEEWRVYRDEERSSKHMRQAEAEGAEYGASFQVLALKAQMHSNPPLLGNRPLCIIRGSQKRDFERLYEAGIRDGYGSETERAVFREYLRTCEEKHKELQLELLSLSWNSRYIETRESGHNVQLTQPELIADEVKWVLNQCLSRFELLSTDHKY